MTEAGVDPIHFRNIMQKLEDWYSDIEEDEESGALPAVFKYLSTHPQSDERMAMIDAYRG